MKDTELKDTNLIFGDHYLFICHSHTKQVKRFLCDRNHISNRIVDFPFVTHITLPTKELQVAYFIMYYQY